jgi:hypothetical protein
MRLALTPGDETVRIVGELSPGLVQENDFVVGYEEDQQHRGVPG